MTSGGNHPTSLGEVWMVVRDAKKLRTIAVIQDLTQRDIAKAVWGSQAHSLVGRIMRGEVNKLTPEAAVRWALLYGVPVDDLFLPRSSMNPRQTVKGDGT